MGMIFLISEIPEDSEVSLSGNINHSIFRSEQFRRLQVTPSMDSVCVMTRNVYAGTDMDMLLKAESLDEIPPLLAQAYQMFESTDADGRVEALAKEILAIGPHIVALQEVTTIFSQSPGDSLQGNAVAAATELYNFSYELISDLFPYTDQNYGLTAIVPSDSQDAKYYALVSWILNTDIELPMMTSRDPFKYDDIRFIDFDIILVRSDVDVNRVINKNYDTSYSLDHLGIRIMRGYTAVYVTVNEKEFCIINTRLESTKTPEELAVQQAQAEELLAFINDQTVPVILAGNINSNALSGATYQMITNGNCTDLWPINTINLDPEGLTYGHDPDLRNSEPDFTQRIDYIFLGPGWHTGLLGPVYGFVTGRNPHNRTPSGLWPSDHGGVVGWIFFYKNL